MRTRDIPLGPAVATLVALSGVVFLLADEQLLAIFQVVFAIFLLLLGESLARHTGINP